VSSEIVVRRIAEAEVDEARAWCELQVSGLGDQFLEQFHQSALAVAEGPLRWPLVHKKVRRYVMARFRMSFISTFVPTRFEYCGWFTPAEIPVRSKN